MFAGCRSLDPSYPHTGNRRRFLSSPHRCGRRVILPHGLFTVLCVCHEQGVRLHSDSDVVRALVFHNETIPVQNKLQYEAHLRVPDGHLVARSWQCGICSVRKSLHLSNKSVHLELGAFSSRIAYRLVPNLNFLYSISDSLLNTCSHIFCAEKIPISTNSK